MGSLDAGAYRSFLFCLQVSVNVKSECLDCLLTSGILEFWRITIG
jgi:hypothetical protein